MCILLWKSRHFVHGPNSLALSQTLILLGYSPGAWGAGLWKGPIVLCMIRTTTRPSALQSVVKFCVVHVSGEGPSPVHALCLRDPITNSGFHTKTRLKLTRLLCFLNMGLSRNFYLYLYIHIITYSSHERIEWSTICLESCGKCFAQASRTGFQATENNKCDFRNSPSRLWPRVPRAH